MHLRARLITTKGMIVMMIMPITLITARAMLITVCGMSVDPATAGFSAEHAGQTYYLLGQVP